MDELTIDMLPLNEEELAWEGEEPESWYTDMIQETQDAQAAIIKQKKTVQYQTMLKQAGYYKGRIDGIWGRQTQAAYQQYINDAKEKGNKLIVSRGDTLSKIANKYGVTVDQIMAINPEIKDRNKIKVDQVINLPSFIWKPAQKNNTSNKQSTRDIYGEEEYALENKANPLSEVIVTAKKKPQLIDTKKQVKNNTSNKQSRNNSSAQSQEASKPFLHDALWSITGPIRALNAEATRFGEIYSDATMHSLNNLWKAPWNRKPYILPPKNNY